MEQNNNYPAQYLFVNPDRGAVLWFESYNAAVATAAQYGGSVLNTATANPDLINLVLNNARRHM